MTITAIRREFDAYYNSCLFMGLVNGDGSIVVDGYIVKRDENNNIELVDITKEVYDNVTNGEFIIPEYIDIIGEGAFENSEIKTIRIPKQIKKIKARAFHSCPCLLEVVIEGNIKEIAPFTFSDSPQLKAVTLPPSICIIRNKAFSTCSQLERIDGLSDNLKEIERYAFFMCENLRHISLPKAMEKIGEKAFAGSGLEEFTFPMGMEVMPKSLLKECNNLIKLNISEGVKVIDESVAFWCKNLKQIRFPSTLTTIKDMAFAYCESIVSIGSLGGVKTIGGRAFYGCNHLRYVCLPEGLQSIKWEAFNCDSLKRVKIPSTVEEIEDKAFVATDADPVILTSEVINIGERAFLYSETRVYCPNFRRGRILYTIYRQEPPADVVEKWINNGKRK